MYTQQHASPKELDDLWTTLPLIDQQFPHARSDKFNVKKLSDRLVKFIEHCCIERYYFFDILKCGKANCDICLLPMLAPHVFSTLNHLPDPVPGPEKHYKKFSDVFGELKSTDLLAKKDLQKTNLSHFQLAFNMSKC